MIILPGFKLCTHGAMPGKADINVNLLTLPELTCSGSHLTESESLLLLLFCCFPCAQLEMLLQSDLTSPLTGLCGSTDAELSGKREQQQQIQSLFETASTLKTDICTAINHSV